MTFIGITLRVFGCKNSSNIRLRPAAKKSLDPARSIAMKTEITVLVTLFLSSIRVPTYSGPSHVQSRSRV
jgi:hypothetical protein